MALNVLKLEMIAERILRKSIILDNSRFPEVVI